MSIQPIARKLASTEAAEIAEAALVLPLVFMLLMGIIWFGRAFNIYSTIQQAAQQGAIKAARDSCATCGNATTNDAAVLNVINGVLQASSLDLNPYPGPIPVNPKAPTVTAACSAAAPAPACGTTDIVTICRSLILNPAEATAPTQCGAVVSIQYPFQFYLPFTSLNMKTVTMTALAQTRMEN